MVQHMIIALTGYTGAGKTTAAGFFPKSWKRVDVDALGHAALKKKEIKKKLVADFGKGIITRGRVDRQKLRAKLTTTQTSVRELNKIVHPFLRKEVQNALKQRKKRNVVIDCAVVKELKLERYVDYVILINAPKKMLKKRQKASWTKEEWELLLQNQKKVTNPDFIIENTGTKEELKQNMKKILARIMK